MSKQTAMMKFFESVLAQPGVKPRSESDVPWQAIARFPLDPNGVPRFDDVEGIPHYWVDLSVESPDLNAITWAEYRMSRPDRSQSGYSDVRGTNFTDIFRASGDFEVRVRVAVNGHRFEDQAKLSAMLEAGHAKDMTPTIRDTITRMKAN